MAIRIAAYANGDDALVAWQLDKQIPGCLGFALYRKRNGKDEIVDNRIGWDDLVPPPAPGTHKPSTEWPIQRFYWSDYDARSGDKVSYKVVAMIGTPDKLNEGPSSDWTPPMLISGGSATGISAYFNRGVVMSQSVARRLKAAGGTPAKSLKAAIADPKNDTRQFLYGQLGETLIAQLQAYAKNGGEIHAVLFELDDPQLIDLLKAFGKRAHVILSNGAHEKQTDDENADARKELKGKIDLKNARLVPSKHLAHNKICVFSDKHGRAEKVWTGSQNWTKTGLCTQANNSLLISDPEIAKQYLEQWNTLLAAGNDYGPELLASNAKSHSFEVEKAKATLWFTPAKAAKGAAVGPDLDFAKTFVDNAQSGILFLMFNPGPANSMLNAILERLNDPKKPQVHVVGVINQDPGTKKTPVVNLFTGTATQEGNQEIIQPEGLDADVAKEWMAEITRNEFLGGVGHAMVHSKVIVIDPFGPHPVVITGSHNLGPAASLRNDENMLVIENDPALARAYVVNIAALHAAYRWRFARQNDKKAKEYHGLHTKPSWQKPYFEVDARKREIGFWIGEQPKKPVAAKKKPSRPRPTA